MTQAAAAVAALNPGVNVTPLAERLEDDNVEALLAAHDVVIDCSDNVDTRYRLGDAAHRTGTPLVFGGAVRTEGQLSVFHSGAGAEEDSPCYRCVFPDMPDAMQAPGCSEAGILGPVTGVIGTMQALAAVRLVLGIGGRQTGKLLLFDGRYGIASITRSRGAWPSQNVWILMITLSPISRRPSMVAEPICGSSTTFGRSSSAFVMFGSSA